MPTALFQASFTDGTIPDTFEAAISNGQHVNAPFGPAPVAGRLFLSTAPDGAACLQSTLAIGDATDTAGHNRSEMRWPFDGALQERWNTIEIFVPRDFDSSAQVCLYQIHDQWNDPTDTLWVTGHEKWVNLGVHAKNEVLLFLIPINAPDDSSNNYRIGGTAPLVRGRWAQMVVHANWAIDGTGFYEIWYDGYKVMSEWNRAAGYNDPIGPATTFGVYAATGDPHMTVTRTAYYRNAAIYAGSAIRSWQDIFVGSAPPKPRVQFKSTATGFR